MLFAGSRFEAAQVPGGETPRRAEDLLAFPPVLAEGGGFHQRQIARQMPGADHQRVLQGDGDPRGGGVHAAAYCHAGKVEGGER